MLPRMVSRTRLKTVLTTLALYTGAALLIGYFGMHAYSGNHGLRAKEDLAQQMKELSEEVARLRAERTEWERRVALLRSNGLDPDMLDERARAMLNYVHPRDLVLSTKAGSQLPSPALAAAR
jgi:cell division protein FtsB